MDEYSLRRTDRFEPYGYQSQVLPLGDEVNVERLAYPISHPHSPDALAASPATVEHHPFPTDSPQPRVAGPKVILALPVYNEFRFIRKAAESLHLALSMAGVNYILGIAEDGSTDGTKEILSQLKGEIPTLEIRSDPSKLGRGKALRQFWAQFDADYYAFCDTDLATDPETIVNLIQRAMAGEDIVVGSRYAKGARVDRPPLRWMVSWVYNWIVRRAFRDGIMDHQCGLKIFSHKAADELVWDTREDSWFWDTEVLVLARERGLSVSEVPVPWVEKKARRTNIRRLLADLNLHGRGILRLKKNLPNYTFRSRYHGARHESAFPAPSRDASASLAGGD